ncbi:MAG TPA: hypothetical protein VIL72_07805, partial [Beijerinckiaceae bacterium]
MTNRMARPHPRIPAAACPGGRPKPAWALRLGWTAGVALAAATPLAAQAQTPANPCAIYGSGYVAV